MLSRFFRVGTFVLVLGVMAFTAVAQDQQPGGGRGGRGGGGPGGGFGFGGGPGGGMMGRMQGGASAVARLLTAEEVRKEVALGEDGYAALQKVQEELRSSFGGPGGPGGGRNFQDMTDEERQKMRDEFTKRQKENDEKVQGVLDEVLTPDGYARLLGLYAQLNNWQAVQNELIAKKISLSDDSKKKIEAAQTKLGEEMRAQFEQARNGGGGGNREEMMARMEEMRKKQDEAVSGSMSDSEKKALEELKGAKFNFPESLTRRGGFGGPGGPGGPGGGAPGGRGNRGGGRPGSDNGT